MSTDGESAQVQKMSRWRFIGGARDQDCGTLGNLLSLTSSRKDATEATKQQDRMRSRRSACLSGQSELPGSLFYRKEGVKGLRSASPCKKCESYSVYCALVFSIRNGAVCLCFSRSTCGTMDINFLHREIRIALVQMHRCLKCSPRFLESCKGRNSPATLAQKE